MKQPDHKELLDLVNSHLGELRSEVKKITFPEHEIRELTANIVTGIARLKQPIKTEILHHHYIPKIIFITASLFIIVTVILTGWYMTAEKLNQYKENDTKYRYLKLQDNRALWQLLDLTDSLYLAEPKMRDSVIYRERQLVENMGLLRRAVKMEAEAKNIRNQVLKHK